MKRKDLINYFANDEEGKEQAERFISFVSENKIFAVERAYTGSRQIYDFYGIGINFYCYSFHYIFYVCGYRLNKNSAVIIPGGGRDGATAAVDHVLSILKEAGHDTTKAEQHRDIQRLS